jgi:hypothetical protein
MIDCVQVTEVTVNNLEGDPIETRYYVRGEKYATLRQAMRAANSVSQFQ